jgi:hypothetical protein
MGDAGRQRVKEHFAWDGKGDFMNRIYENTLARREPELVNAPFTPEQQIEH